MSQLALYDQNCINLRPLWPEQVPGVEGLYQAVREGHTRIVLYAPTGYGKTQVSAHLIARALDKGTRPLFTVPAISLVNQTLEKFEAEGIRDVGIIQANHHRTNPDAQIQIASIQTLVRRHRPDVDFILVDECHLQNRQFNKMLDSPEWSKVIAIGLSATPWTKGLGLRWKKMVVGARIQQLIDAGRLSDFRIYHPRHSADRSAVKMEKGEFVESSASEVMRSKAIVGDVIEEWQEKGPGNKTFMFCVDRNHAKAQMAAFIDCGFPFGYIDGDTPPGDRDNERGTRKWEFARMRHGEIAGIASVRCLIAGVDEDVRCIVDLQLTNSEMVHQQKWGRGIRTAVGKDYLIGLDHANNNGETGLGLFSDIFYDHLDCSKPGDKAPAYSEEKKPPKPRVCTKCHLLVPAGRGVCPSCGEPVRARTNVEQHDGKLGLIDGKKSKGPEKQDFYSGLLGLARERGFKDGWAAQRYRERFGVWPDGLTVAAKTPSMAVRTFDHKCRIEYLRKKRNEEIINGNHQNGTRSRA
jgi:superfamily II DNA or RNA helicase/RNA polymerase subunit RPABC4/transcription elongation factor Spt4